MKTTIDISEEMLSEAIRYAGVKTKRDAVIACVSEYNERHRMADLVKLLGTFGDDFPSHDQAEAVELSESEAKWKQ